MTMRRLAFVGAVVVGGLLGITGTDTKLATRRSP
jgi:hypothetical protein